MSLFDREIVIPRIKEDEVPRGQTFCAKFISAGLVGYKEGNYLLNQHVLDQMAYTLKGCAVVIGHQDIMDMDDMRKKAAGYVSNVSRSEDGCWTAEFVISDDDAIEKITNGDLKYVSCAYKADLSNEGGKLNNIPYKKEIIGGQMTHLALVKNPRYNGTDIWKNDVEDEFISEAVEYNKKDNIMFGFKKVEVELDKKTLVNTSAGEKTIEELVNELEAATTAIKEKDAQISEKDVRITDLQSQVEEAKKAIESDPKVETVSDPKVETKPVEETDAGLKQELANSLNDEAKATLVKVPNVKL